MATPPNGPGNGPKLDPKMGPSWGGQGLRNAIKTNGFEAFLVLGGAHSGTYFLSILGSISGSICCHHILLGHSPELVIN